MREFLGFTILVIGVRWVKEAVLKIVAGLDSLYLGESG